MFFKLDTDGTKRFEVTFADDCVLMKFLTPQNELVLHPKAYQRIVEMRLRISRTLIDVLGGELVYFRKRLFHSVYVVVEHPYECIQIRKFNTDSGLFYPSNNGISMSPLQWLKFLDIVSELEELHPIFQAPNMCPVLHHNQEEVHNCYNCHSDNTSSEEDSSEEDSILSSGNQVLEEQVVSEVIPDEEHVTDLGAIFHDLQPVVEPIEIEEEEEEEEED